MSLFPLTLLSSPWAASEASRAFSSRGVRGRVCVPVSWRISLHPSCSIYIRSRCSLEKNASHPVSPVWFFPSCGYEYLEYLLRAWAGGSTSTTGEGNHAPISWIFFFWIGYIALFDPMRCDVSAGNEKYPQYSPRMSKNVSYEYLVCK